MIKKEKEKKKTRNKERVPFCRLELAELHGGVQISNIEVAVKPKLVIHKFKKGFSFYIYASTSLDTKTLTIAPNRTFESCMSIRCLTSQHIFRFLHFYRVSPIGYLSRKNLYPLSLTLEDPVVPFVFVFRRRDNLLAWRELMSSNFPFCLCCPINSTEEPSVVSCLTGS